MVETIPDAGADLAQWAASGDHAALDRALVVAGDAAHAQASRLLGRTADADDATQEALVQLVRSAKRYDPQRPFRPWLARLVHDACCRLLRSAHRRRRHEGAVPPPTPADEPVDCEAVRAAVLELPESLRAAVEMHYFAGLDQAEAATALGIDKGACAMRLSRARERLRELLQRRGVGVTTAVALAALTAVPAHAAPTGLAAGIAAQASAGTLPATTIPLSTMQTGVWFMTTHPILTAGVFAALSTTALMAAGFVLAGSCLTVALVVGAEPVPTPVAVPAAQPPVSAAPVVAKPAWATDSGKDQYGDWADLKVADVTQRFRWIQPGTFTMGSSQAEKDAALASVPNSKPGWFAPEVQHQVTLTRGFWLADSACTQALWQTIMGSNPALFQSSPQNPVEMVSRDDCQQFLSKLNDRVSGGGFRLPSEAQWEYACRAGTNTAFSFGTTISLEQVNYGGNHLLGGVPKDLYRQKTVPVKSLQPNAWGLYEMHGNVWQWCNDWHGAFSGSSERDPTGPSSGSYRVMRGGSWSDYAWRCRSASRPPAVPDLRGPDLGFRVAAQGTPTSSQVQPSKDF